MGNSGEIIIDIDEQGDVEISVNGVQGPGCVDLTKQIEDALGVVTDRTKTEEFDGRARAARDNRLHNRRG